jgi:hypothetical protein
MRLILSLTIVLLAGCAPRQASPGSAQTLVLNDVTVIDGTGSAPRPRMTVVIQEGVIRAIFPVGRGSLPAGARELDVAGRYVIPGLIDSHVHLASFDRPDRIVRALLRFALLGGVTTVRDMGGNIERVAALSAESRVDSALLPRIYYSAVVAGPAWFSTYDPARLKYWSRGQTPGTAPGVRLVSDTTDTEQVVREAKSLGAHGIKIFADVSAPAMAVLSSAAHAAGLRVWSHTAAAPSRPQDGVAAGVDVLSHSDQLVWAASAPGAGVGDRTLRRTLLRSTKPDAPSIQALLDSMRSRGTMLEPTLLVMQMGRVRDDGGPPAPIDTLPAWAAAAARAAHARGVRIVAGTDALGAEVPFIHSELQLLVQQAGLTPLEAIQAATQRGAQALGLESSLGTLAVGKRADLVVLNANPAADIRNTQAILHVIRGGHVHTRTEEWETPPLAEPPIIPRR